MWRYRYVKRKRYIPYFFAIGLLMLFFIAFSILKPQLPVVYINKNINAPKNISYLAKTEEFNLPSKMTLYKIKIGIRHEKDVKKLAQHFKINSEIIYNQDSKEWIAYNNGQLLIVNHETWIYRCFYRQLITGQHNLPIDDEAVAIAKKTLGQVGINTEEINNWVLGTTTEDGQVTQKSIYFYRQIDEYPVLGPAQLVVDIGSGGRLEGITSHHWALEKVDQYKLKTLVQAVTELKANQALYDLNTPASAEGLIYEVYLAYYWFSNTKYRQVPYLQPVYVFSGEVETEAGTTNFNAVVPALKGVTVHFID